MNYSAYANLKKKERDLHATFLVIKYQTLNVKSVYFLSIYFEHLML